MLIKRSHCRSYRKGFTLAECVLSLMVVGIILTAAATLAFAMNSAERVTDKMGESQAYIRYATMRVSELIRGSNMVFATSYLHDGIAIWTDDDYDGRIDSAELVYVEYDAANDELGIVTYPESNGAVAVNDVGSGSVRANLNSGGAGNYTGIVFNCTAASFPAGNPVGDLVSIQLTVEEDGVSKQYQIAVRRIVSMKYLLDGSGELRDEDDDGGNGEELFESEEEEPEGEG